MGTFDARLAHIGYVPEFPFVKDAIINVCDTADTVKLWFDEQKIEATASDIVALTALVLQERHRLATSLRLEERHLATRLKLGQKR